ncbi:DNA cytosine methyltransferase [Winogradskyella sp.]|jgi:DNA (cytosine-5)-methyltransferase 1|uniref:DNA cytosine methyltransferase n=1 Tax=Winogradskyella sp. TaxID=1883156 RepID=UPI0025E5F3A7|nr:DNA cytosine methyltransferase [Winogradskyella sp.]MCT4628291.1 DNA cytosine methyltransferase [Winogradskyella sp.]
MHNKIPIIDLFAGPGGLGEGFMSIKDNEGKSIFDIKLSIEKDINAHKTLTLRSFFRQFVKDNKKVPEDYYNALRVSDISKREILIEKMLDKYEEGTIARNEAKLIELGSKKWPAKRVDRIIKDQLGNVNNWVLIGGPPCQAYSNAGRSRVGGIKKEDHRVYLYEEYLRIIKRHKPSVFVMENVKGLLSAKVDGEKVFDWMKRDLKVGNNYSIHSLVKPIEKDSDFLIKSEKFGVPQMRHRVILLGIRKDYKHLGDYLKEKKEVTLKSVIGNLPAVRSGLNRRFTSYHDNEVYKNGKPKRLYQNLVDSDSAWLKEMSQNIKQIKKWGELELNGLSSGPKNIEEGTGAEFIKANNVIARNHVLKDWFVDKRLKGMINHQSRSHLTQDLMRYLFAGLYVEKHERFPRLKDYASHSKDLLPDHASAESGKFADRFRVQVPNKPATTVTSHISKDGHYFIHYDTSQCRSLTVREAARIQTFPDNYLFRGSRTVQYHQVGNAVPPYLAFQISEIVVNILNQKNG